MSNVMQTVLEILKDNKVSGRDLRELLADRGHDFTRVRFYWWMNDIEEAGYVRHSEQRIHVAGADVESIVRRHYEITEAGTAHLKALQTA